MIRSLIQNLEARLQAAGVKESRTCAEYLLSSAMGVSRLDLYLLNSICPEKIPRSWVDACCSRLERHEPLQYVLGETEFMGRIFRCDRRALIPRPETEEMIRHAISLLVQSQNTAPAIVDAGTGSGCVAITLRLEFPGAAITATECSAEALELAQENAEALEAGPITWLNSNLLDGLAAHSMDMVISNPPYIRSSEIRRLDRNIRDYEPRLALDGGGDGLVIIRRLVSDALRVLRPGGTLIMEIGEDQGAAVKALLDENEFDDVRVVPDINGHDRVAIACRRRGRLQTRLSV